MKPSKRAEFAEHGAATMRSARAYIENRISYTAYQEAVQSGIRLYEKRVG